MLDSKAGVSQITASCFEEVDWFVYGGDTVSFTITMIISTRHVHFAWSEQCCGIPSEPAVF